MKRSQSSDSLDISDSLRALMHGRKLTVSQMAERCGVSKSAMEKYLAGPSSPRAATIKAICTEFDVSADWVLFGYNPFSHAVLLSSSYAAFQALINEMKQPTDLSKKFNEQDWGSPEWREFLLNISTERANELQADVSSRMYKNRKDALSGVRRFNSNHL